MIEERWTKSKISDIAKHLAIQESRNKDALVCRCTFHFGTSFRPATKDEIIKNTCKKTFTISHRERYKVPAEAYHMGKWLGYTVELCFDGQWFNIDQWHRSASGRLRHRYLHAAPERDILSSPYDELALLKNGSAFRIWRLRRRTSFVRKIRHSSAARLARGISSFGEVLLI